MLDCTRNNTVYRTENVRYPGILSPTSDGE